MAVFATRYGFPSYAVHLRTGAFAILMCVSALAAHFASGWFGREVVNVPVALEPAKPLSVSFMTPLSGTYMIAIEAVPREGVNVVELMGMNQPRPGRAVRLVWQVSDRTGQVLAEGDSGDIRSGSYSAARGAGRHIGRFTAHAFGRYELRARAPHPVEFPTTLRLSVMPLAPGYPGAPQAGPLVFWADLFALYVAIPGALIWWALSLLRRFLET